MIAEHWLFTLPTVLSSSSSSVEEHFWVGPITWPQLACVCSTEAEGWWPVSRPSCVSDWLSCHHHHSHHNTIYKSLTHLQAQLAVRGASVKMKILVMNLTVFILDRLRIYVFLYFSGLQWWHFCLWLDRVVPGPFSTSSISLGEEEEGAMVGVVVTDPHQGMELPQEDTGHHLQGMEHRHRDMERHL